MIRIASRFLITALLIAGACPAVGQVDQAILDEANKKATGDMGYEMNNVESSVTDPVPEKKQPDVSLEEAMSGGATGRSKLHA